MPEARLQRTRAVYAEPEFGRRIQTLPDGRVARQPFSPGLILREQSVWKEDGTARLGNYIPRMDD